LEFVVKQRQFDLRDWRSNPARGVRELARGWNALLPAGQFVGIALAIVILLGVFLISHESGKATGFSDGYEVGFGDGEMIGLEAGREEGVEQGRKEGYSSGYEDGLSKGYDEGKSDGEGSGYRSGYEKGYYAGRDCAVRTPTYISAYSWCTNPTPPVLLWTLPIP
jgi:hypothetical protein